MKNILESTTHMGGYLTGIGKVHKDGEVEYKVLEKPIKNRITSAGIDHLLMYNGSTTSLVDDCGYGANGMAYSPFLINNRLRIYNNLNLTNHYGILTYCGIGSGTTQTQFTDTALESQIGNLTSTRITSSTAYQGTKINSYGNYTVRVTHQTASMSTNCSVSEIGWFGRYGSTPTYPMFARVVLPSPIQMLEGEYLIVTYELTFDLGGQTAVVIPNVFNLLDRDGNTLQAKRKLVVYQYNNGWNSGGSFPYLSYGSNQPDNTCMLTQGSDTSDLSGHYYNFSKVYPAFYKMDGNTSGNANRSAIRVHTFTSYADGTFPAEGSVRQDRIGQIAGNVSYSVQEYACQGQTSKYRDRTYTLGTYAPDMTSNPEGYYDFCGFDYCGYEYLFGYDDNGTWVPQYLRKYANQEMTFRFRLRYSTDDTTNDVYGSDPADPV